MLLRTSGSHFDPSTNIIDVYVRRVRRKVDGQQAYPLIHTVPASGTVSVLLTKALTSSTFKLALIAIGTFGMIVSAISATSTCPRPPMCAAGLIVRSCTSTSVCGTRMSNGTRWGRRPLIQQRVATRVSDTRVSAGRSVAGRRLRGNLKGMASTATAARGMDGVSWIGTVALTRQAGRCCGHARNISRRRCLLVGRRYSVISTAYRSDQDCRDPGRRIDLCAPGVASILVTRRPWDGIEAINVTSRASCSAVSTSGSRCAANRRRMGSRCREPQPDAGSHRDIDGGGQAGQRQCCARPADPA